jgi:hypothetical protein
MRQERCRSGDRSGSAAWHGRLMLAVCGTGGRTRTYDLRIWNPLLYQLSYARMKNWPGLKDD